MPHAIIARTMASRGGGTNSQQQVVWSSRRISKCSGKETGYGLFLKREGRKRFQHLHGHPFQHLDPIEQEMMGDIWQSLTEQQRIWYRNQASEMNKNPAEVERRRHEGELLRRAFAHENAATIAGLKEHANENLKSYKDQQRKDYGYVVVPKPESSIDPKPVLDADMKSYRLKSRMDLTPLFKFDHGNVTNRTFNYVGVLNYTAMLDQYNAKVLGFPAELAVVQFTLLQGITSHKTFKLKFDINELTRDRKSGEQDEWFTVAQHKANKFAEEHKICPTKGGSAQEAFEWLLDSIDTRGITVIDSVQFAAQVGTLNFLSEMMGTHEQQAYFNQIGFYCLQDVALAIKDAFPRKVTKSDAEIEQLLQTNMFLDKCELYCEEHEKFFAYSLETYYLLQMCPMHQALSKAQLFFHFCAENNICGFEFDDFTEQHRFCTINQETVPLYVANLSISSQEYCARHVQNGITPAPVIPEEPDAEDLNIRKVEAMRMNAGLPPLKSRANPKASRDKVLPYSTNRMPNIQLQEPYNRMLDTHNKTTGRAEMNREKYPQQPRPVQRLTPRKPADFYLNFDEVDDDTWSGFYPLYA